MRGKDGKPPRYRNLDLQRHSRDFVCHGLGMANQRHYSQDAWTKQDTFNPRATNFLRSVARMQPTITTGSKFGESSQMAR
jgi:hypothetical protein